MDRPKNIKTWNFQVAWIVIIACSAYVVISSVIDNPISVRLLNSTIISTSFVCVVLYAKLAWQAVSRRRPTNADLMGLGLFLASLGSMLQRIPSMMVRDFGLAWISDNVIIPGGLFIILLSRIFQVLAIGATDNGVERHKWETITIALGGGFTLALLVTVTQLLIGKIDP